MLKQQAAARVLLRRLLRGFAELERRTIDAGARLGALPGTTPREVTASFHRARNALVGAASLAIGSNLLDRMSAEQAWVASEGQHLDDDELGAILYPGVPRAHVLQRVRQLRKEAKRRAIRH